MHKFLLGIILILGTQYAQAQVEMADKFRGEGKIYVVIAVILIILAGFFFLLFKLDKRAKRLEEEVSEK
ncbi:CcmD family protein [Ekhidna sp.]